MYNDTITIFNRKRGPAGDVWYSTVLEGVHLAARRAASNGKYGSETGGGATALVPYERAADGIDLGGKRYLPPKAWQEAEEPTAAITFTAGEWFDFFLAGQWEGAPVADSEYAGGFYDHMNRTHDGVYAVAAVQRYGALPHFEIEGK